MNLAGYTEKYFFPENRFKSTSEIRTNQQLRGLIMAIKRILNGTATGDENLINAYFNTMVLFLTYMGLYYRPNRLRRLFVDKKKQIEHDHRYLEQMVGINIKKDYKSIMVDLAKERTETKHFSVGSNFSFFEVLLSYYEPAFTENQIAKIVNTLRPFIVYCELELTYNKKWPSNEIDYTGVDGLTFDKLSLEEKELYVKANGEHVAIRQKHAWQAHLYMLHGFPVEAEIKKREVISIKVLNKDGVNLYYQHLDNIKERLKYRM